MASLRCWLIFVNKTSRQKRQKTSQKLHVNAVNLISFSCSLLVKSLELSTALRSRQFSYDFSFDKFFFVFCQRFLAISKPTYRQRSLGSNLVSDRLSDLYFSGHSRLVECPPSSDRSDLVRFSEHASCNKPDEQ